MFNIKTGLLTGFNSNSKKNSNFTKIARISKVYSCGYFHSPKSDIPNQMFTFKRHCKKKKMSWYSRGWRRQWHPTPVLLPGNSHGQRSLVGCSPWGRKSWTQLSEFTFTFYFPALEKEMATHSSVLAWRIPGTGQPGGLPSMGSNRVGHDWSDLAAAAAVQRLKLWAPNVGGLGSILGWGTRSHIPQLRVWMLQLWPSAVK